MKLYRADGAGMDSITRTDAWWASDLDHARHYTSMPGFGGPHLYCATVRMEPTQILDLRPDLWRVLEDKFGLDRDDYGAGELDHEIVSALRNMIGAHGYEWAVLAVRHPSGVHDEWLHTGDEPFGPPDCPQHRNPRRGGVVNPGVSKCELLSLGSSHRDERVRHDIAASGPRRPRVQADAYAAAGAQPSVAECRNRPNTSPWPASCRGDTAPADSRHTASTTRRHSRPRLATPACTRCRR